MKPFNMKLSDDDRARLERLRIALGLRSHAEVVRSALELAENLDYRKSEAPLATRREAKRISQAKWRAKKKAEAQ